MNHRKALRLLARSGAGALLFNGVLWGVARADAAGLILDWSVPPESGCPTSQQVSAHVAALVSGEPRNITPLRVSANVKHAERGDWLLTIQNSDGTARRLEASSCLEAADAGAVLIAWMLTSGRPAPEPLDTAPVPVPAPPGPAPNPNPTPSSSAPFSVPPRPSRAKRVARENPPPESKHASPAIAEEVKARPMQREHPAENEARPSALAPRHPARQSPWVLIAAVAGAFDRGTLPGFTPGLELRAGVRRDWFEAGLSGAAFSATEVELPNHAGDGGRFSLAVGGARICFVHEFRPRSISTRACGLVEVDRLRATGFGVTTARSEVRYWDAWGAELRAGFGLGGPLALTLGAAGIASRQRQVFTLDELGTVTRTSALALRVAIGLELSWPTPTDREQPRH